MSKTAFVTGGTGFVGSHVVEELLRRDLDEIRCMVRSDPKWLADLDVTYVNGDLSDVETLWKALNGVTHVYHIAGITRARSPEQFHEINVQGTLNLLGAVKHAAPDVQRVLITSSLAAVGECDADVATEESPLQPVSRYGKSKAEMERALREAHDMTQSYWDALPITVIRPPAVYGPRDRDILKFFQTVERHVCPIVTGGSDRGLSLVHAQDLARGIVDASFVSETRGETYFLGSERSYSWNEIKEATLKALDTWAVSIPVPSLLIETVGAVCEAWGTVTGTHPPFNRDKARELRRAVTACSIEKAREHFGFQPQISLEEGIADTLKWYRENGWL